MERIRRRPTTITAAQRATREKGLQMKIQVWVICVVAYLPVLLSKGITLLSAADLFK